MSTFGKQTVMGLDLSMTGTGLVVLQRGTYRVLAWHLIQTESMTKGEERVRVNQKGERIFVGSSDGRINYIAKQVMREWRRWEPRLTIIEEQTFSRNKAYARQTGEMTGVVKHRLYLAEAPYDLKTSTHLKKEFTGYGKATKDEMIAQARVYWPECPDDDNVADAFSAACYADDNYEKIVLAA